MSATNARLSNTLSSPRKIPSPPPPSSPRNSPSYSPRPSARTLLVAIPNRNKIYVFPKLSPSYQVLTEAVIADYESSSHPVSRELFEYENGRLQALGIYR